MLTNDSDSNEKAKPSSLASLCVPAWSVQAFRCSSLRASLTVRLSELTPTIGLNLGRPLPGGRSHCRGVVRQSNAQARRCTGAAPTPPPAAAPPRPPTPSSKICSWPSRSSLATRNLRASWPRGSRQLASSWTPRQIGKGKARLNPRVGARHAQHLVPSPIVLAADENPRPIVVRNTHNALLRPFQQGTKSAGWPCWRGCQW